MSCQKRDPVKPSDSHSVITDGIHARRWVLMCRHVVYGRISVFRVEFSFSCDTSVNIGTTHMASVACNLVHAPARRSYARISGDMLVCDRGLLCVQKVAHLRPQITHRTSFLLAVHCADTLSTETQVSVFKNVLRVVR